MSRVSMLIAAIAILAGSGAAAGAVDFTHRTPEFPPRVYTCRADGGDVALGMRRCLATPHGPRLAECGIALNVSTWRASDDFCP